MILLPLFASCITCNRDLQEALFNKDLLPDFFTLFSGFIVLGLVLAVLAFFSFKKYRKNSFENPDNIVLNPVPLSTTSMILGMGIGGFIDGILFHQILQWHGMLSSRIAIDTLLGKSINMFWDGIFHLFTLTAVIIGVVSLVRLINKKFINSSPGLAWGGSIAGWGIFNFVEGIINHQIVNLHNVNEFSLNQDIWNLGFLGSGVILIIIGSILIYIYSFKTKKIKARSFVKK